MVAAVYVAALVALPPQALTHHDEGAKYLQVRNLRLAPLGLDWSINYPARRLDPDLEFVPFHPKQHYVDGRDRIYLQWPIFLGLLTRIFWKTLGFWGLYVVPLLAGLGTLWAAYLLALSVGIPRRFAWLAVPLLGLATPIALYSLLYFEHTVACLLVTLSLLAGVSSLREGRVSTRLAAVCAALLAVAVYFRSELYVLALVLALAYAWVAWRQGSWRPVLAWTGAFALALVPLWAFYAINEGTLLPTHALWYFAGGEPSGSGGIPRPGLPPLRYIATAGWGVVPAFLLGPANAPLAPTLPAWATLAGLAGTAFCLAAASGRWRGTGDARRKWPLVALTLGLALLALPAALTLLSPEPYYNLHGFLLAAPFVALAVWPPGRPSPSPLPARGGFLYATAFLYVGLHALVISALSGLGPISLHEWGQRYLLPAYPLLVVLALLAAHNILPDGQATSPAIFRRGSSSPWPPNETAQEERAATGSSIPYTFPSTSVGMHTRAAACLLVWIVLVVLGLGFTARGYTVLSEERAQVSEWLALVRSLPAGEPLLTDTWWLPLNLASDFYSRPIMLAEGDERIGHWADEMRRRGVTAFSLATAEPAVLGNERLGRIPGLTADGPPREARGIWLQRYTLEPAAAP